MNRIVKKSKATGLGDTIAAFTQKTGIKAVVEKVSEVTGVPCDCASRQEALNVLIPYKK